MSNTTVEITFSCPNKGCLWCPVVISEVIIFLILDLSLKRIASRLRDVTISTANFSFHAKIEKSVFLSFVVDYNLSTNLVKWLYRNLLGSQMITSFVSRHHWNLILSYDAILQIVLEFLYL